MTAARAPACARVGTRVGARARSGGAIPAPPRSEVRA